MQVARRLDPEGVGKTELLIVGGRPGSRGVVTSASYEARAYGVRSGMPMDRAVRLCPGATVVPVPRNACSRTSREVRAALERWAPVVEAASVDEFYLDLSGTERLYGGEELAATARRIQAAVRADTGIAVSVGGATRRMLAKMAAGLAKPEGVYVVPAGEEAAFMLRWELSDLPGVGATLAETLGRRGVRTVADVLPYDRASLESWLGAARGGWLWERVRGIDPTPVEPRGDPKGISHERTFSRDIHNLDALEAELLRLVVELGADLRRKGFRARTVRVYLRDRDFTDRGASRTSPEGIESERAIGSFARPLLRELWERRPIGVRLLGIGVSNLVPVDRPEQLPLAELAAPAETDRDRAIARAADRVRDRFGVGAILPARALKANP